MQNEIKQLEPYTELLKVLAHPVRLCIVKGLYEKGSCNVTTMQLCLKLPQSTVSMHLQKLRSARIIEGERIGLEVIYHVSNEQVKELLSCLFYNK